MSHRGITCEINETASGPGCGTRGRRQALHPLRGDAPVTWRYTRSERVQCLRIGCNAYGSGAPHNARIPKEESAAPHASPANRNTRSHKTPKHRRCGGRRRAWRARARHPVGGGGAWPGFEIGRAEPHASTPGPTGVKGAGGSGGHGRASRRGAERSEAA